MMLFTSNKANALPLASSSDSRFSLMCGATRHQRKSYNLMRSRRFNAVSAGRADEFKIHIEKKDLTIRTLAEMARESELNLKPSYQREFVWDKQAILNNLIETALRDLPIPEIWLHEQNTIGPKGRTKLVADVVDGKQRLTTLLGFLNNDNPLKSKAAPDSNEFRLQGLEILHQLNGKTFDELADVDEEDYQTKFRNTTLPARIIRVDSSEDGVFEVYRRINSGSMNLLEQQIRRAFFKDCSYIQLLDTLVNNKDLFWLRGDSVVDPKNRDCEVVLRFFAMRNNYVSFRSPVRVFLNRELREHRDMDAKEQAEYTEIFKKTISLYRHLYGDDSSETLPMLKRAPVLDVVLPVLSLYSRGPVAFEFASHREQLRAEFQRLYRTDKFRGALTRASTAGGLKYARDMYEDSLRCVLPNLGPISTARKFPKEKELKAKLFKEQGGMCNECAEAITRTGDSSHLDHIKPFSLGGLSVPENAQLLCVRCNLAKKNNPDWHFLKRT